jgi:hypothetical protein
MRPGATPARLARGLAPALLLALVLAGCAVVGRQRDASPTDGYRRLLDRWTRTEHAYDELETRLYVSATYKSWPFRQAYVAEYARIFLLPERERTAMLARETAALEQYHDFVLSAYTPVRQAGDFLTRTGIWRLYLEGPGGVRVPSNRVERVSEPLPVLMAFYPYVDRWSRVFLVRFPKQTAEGRDVLPAPETDPFRLVIASTEARAELVWGTRQ